MTDDQFFDALIAIIKGKPALWDINDGVRLTIICDESQREKITRIGDALETVVMLRKQPGSEAANDESQYSFMTIDGTNKIKISAWKNKSNKKLLLCPVFCCEGHARAALETVGEEKVLRMMETFHS